MVISSHLTKSQARTAFPQISYDERGDTGGISELLGEQKTGSRFMRFRKPERFAFAFALFSSGMRFVTRLSHFHPTIPKRWWCEIAQKFNSAQSKQTSPLSRMSTNFREPPIFLLLNSPSQPHIPSNKTLHSPSSNSIPKTHRPNQNKQTK